jgi:TRAP-type C4-dicarboxylate transport system permease small subunit
MKRFLDGVFWLNRWMQHLAAAVLTFILFLTTADVILRLFKKPIPGAVEIIAICGGAVLGLTIPITSWMRGHISVDFVLNELPPRVKDGFNIVTRCVAVMLCVLIAWNCAKIGAGFLEGTEVSGTLQIPLYPVAYGLGVCFFMLALVLFCDILKIFGGTYE